MHRAINRETWNSQAMFDLSQALMMNASQDMFCEKDPLKEYSWVKPY